MKCHACGAAMEAGENFCSVCGAKSAETNETAAASAALAQPAPTQTDQPVPVTTSESSNTSNTSSTSNTPNTSNIDDKAKQIANDYFTFVWECLKTPSKAVAGIDATSKLHGLITLGILTVFMPLFDYIRALIHTTPSLNLGAMGDFSEFAEMFGFAYQPTFGYDFMRPLIVTAISLALVITVIYVASTLLKSSLNFMDVAAKFGAIMVVPTAVLLLAGLLSWIGLGNIVIFIRAFGMLGVAVAILYTTHSFNQEQTKLDSFYLGAGVLAASYLLYSIVQIIFA